MTRKLTMIATAILLSGCMTTTEYNTYNDKNKKDFGSEIFTSSFEYNIQNINTLKENIELLKSIDDNKNLMIQISENKSPDAPYYDYYYNYILLQHDILNEIKIKKLEKKDNIAKEKINKEIRFLLNACKNSNQDIADDLQNLAQENPLHFKHLTKDEDALVSECLNKIPELDTKKNDNDIEDDKEVPIKAVVVVKEPVKSSVVLKPNTKPKINKKIESEKVKPVVNHSASKFNVIKNNIEPYFFLIQAHCNEEDSYLLPDDVKTFKNKAKEFSKGDVKLEKYIYNEYYGTIKECYEIYNSNDLLNHVEISPLNIENPVKNNNDANVKTLEIIKNKGYTGYNFKESVDSVLKDLFKEGQEPEDILKKYSKIVRVIDNGDDLNYYDTLNYNGNDYYVFSNDTLKIQVYYPKSNKKFIKNEKLNKKLYYSVFDYGYIDSYKTLIVKDVNL